MKSLEELSIACDDGNGNDLNDDVVAGCIPSLTACTGMRTLKLNDLNVGTNRLSGIFPGMAALLGLSLNGNSIDDDCARVLAQGLSECKQFHRLNLARNRISDDGLEVLIQGLPESVNYLNLGSNQVTLARELQLLRFKTLLLWGNSLCLDGPRVIAVSLVNPECRLEELNLYHTNVRDKGVATLAGGLRGNQSLTRMSLFNITETGWNALLSIMCDKTSISATHGSNHSLQHLRYRDASIPQDIKIMLELNSDQNKSRVAARKILLAHRHLDMKPLFDRKLNLLPRVDRALCGVPPRSQAVVNFRFCASDAHGCC